MSGSRVSRRRVTGRAAAAAALAVIAVCAPPAAAAIPAQEPTQSSAASRTLHHRQEALAGLTLGDGVPTAAAGPLYHHPDHDELPEETFVPQSAVTGDDQTDPSGETPVGDLPPGAGRIIGSPDPGPDPQHSGDRGGWRQLALLGALAAAVTAIMVRVLLAARRHDRNQTRTALPG